uniref:RING-type domain-containing protein n=1 Tax=Hyaloperonospora arabidopsidis (strain Emoy2) TaxID=559515 RepID=M4BU12_HYAAE
MTSKKHEQLRVLADGWGQQTTGSVFCADSSLRYIYESASTSSSSRSLPLPTRAFSTTKDFDVSHVTVPPNHLFRGNTRCAPFGGIDAASGESQCVDDHQVAIARACHAIVLETRLKPPSFQECSVCFSANAVAQLSLCGHTFHPQCFLRWFRSNPTCPLCRAPVDKIHEVASPVFDQQQNELDVLMAEMDQDDDPLRVGNADQLMSLFETELDTDMELVALEALGSAPADSIELTFEPGEMADETMDMDLKQHVIIGDQYEETMNTTDPLAIQQQFPPASTIPNYWNVLNQGTTGSAVPLEVAPQRMVHIVPKVEDKTLPDSVAVSSRTIERTGNRQTGPAYNDHLYHEAVAGRAVSCRCTGGCKNGRCACVKEGGMCGVSCRCTSCKNPYLMVKAAGADINALLKDNCFMHNVSKTRDMVRRLQEPVKVPCCDSTIKVVECVQGYTCELCNRRYDFSWCTTKLLASERTPRNHCAICRRCCDHRDVHCHDCGRCYFAGVVASLPCPCKEALSHRKHREAMAKDKTEEAEEEAEGECCIM